MINKDFIEWWPTYGNTAICQSDGRNSQMYALALTIEILREIEEEEREAKNDR